MEPNRNAHQWRRVRYSYMDCRRQAKKRGLVILGTRKIWDSSLAAIGMLWAKRQGKRQFRAYHDRVFERFWRRELDIEDAEAIASVLSEVHADRTGFRSYLAGAGRIEHDTVRESAEAAGVFGVPSFIVEGEVLKDRRAAGALTLPGAVSTPFAGWSKAKRTLDKAIRDTRDKGAAIANRRKHPLRSCEGGGLPTLHFHARWR
jgi:predicted DsbA family dithiol-disulfide isomerase